MKQKPVQVSLRLPTEIVAGIDKIAAEETTDRTTIITQALAFWVEINGKMTRDGDYIKNQKEIREDIDQISKTLVKYEEDIKNLQSIVSKQNDTIDMLIQKIPVKK